MNAFRCFVRFALPSLLFAGGVGSIAGEPWTLEKRVELAAKAATVDTAWFEYSDVAQATQIPEALKAKLAELPVAEPFTQALDDTRQWAEKHRIRETLLVMDLGELNFPQTYSGLRTDGDPAKVAEAIVAERREELGLSADDDIELADGTEFEPLASGVEGDFVWIVEDMCCAEKRAQADPKVAKALQAAFASVADAAHVFVLAPGEKGRERIVGMAEQAPPPLDKFVRERIGDDLVWGAYGFDSRGEGKLLLRGEAVDAEAAARIREGWKTLVAAGLKLGRESGLFERAEVSEETIVEAEKLATLRGEGTSLELTIDFAEPSALRVVGAAVAVAALAVPTPAEPQEAPSIEDF